MAKLAVDRGCCGAVTEAPLEETAAAELARAFAALADPARLQILAVLAATPGAEVCACDFVAPTGKSQPTVSHHLKVLTEAGLIEGERRTKWVWYRVRPERLVALRTALAFAG
jgi:ArsR family transcriptional regulator